MAVPVLLLSAGLLTGAAFVAYWCCCLRSRALGRALNYLVFCCVAALLLYALYVVPSLGGVLCGAVPGGPAAAAACEARVAAWAGYLVCDVVWISNKLKQKFAFWRGAAPPR